MTELEEVAESLAPTAPRFSSLVLCEWWVKGKMPEGETWPVIEGVAEALYSSQEAGER